MNVILDLSLKLQWDNQGSCGSKSLQIWLRRAQTTTTLWVRGSQIGPKSPSPQALMPYTKHTKLHVTNVMNRLQLFSFHKRFFEAWLTHDSFPQQGFMFPQATCFLEHKVVLRLGSHRIFFLTEVLLFHEHTDSPIVGASDMSQASTCLFM